MECVLLFSAREVNPMLHFHLPPIPDSSILGDDGT